MTDESRRESLLKRIRALRAKTVENGCTEGEAMSAAAKVAEMMAEYDLSQSEVERSETLFKQAERPVSDEIGIRLWKLAMAIDKLCSTSSFTDYPDLQATKITFFGREDDVMVAGYILDIAESALRTSTRKHDATHQFYRAALRRRRRIAFIDGMIETMSASIREIAWTRQRTEAGRGLVVSKNAMVAAEMNRIGLRLSSWDARQSYDFDPSFDQGRAAGKDVRFTPGLAEAEKVALLEGAKEE